MLKSMTGYANSKYENEGRTYSVEIKSVNHKYNDITIKLPRFLNSLEEGIRKKIAKYISRGKIEVYISFQNFSDKGKSIKINTDLANVYITELKTLAEQTNIIDNVNVIDIAKFPDILNIESEEDESLIENELNVALDEALIKFVSMREEEGNVLARDLENRLNLIEKQVSEVCELSKDLISEYKEKLRKRIKELLEGETIDEARLAQEVVIYADKCSIEEEVTRLKSHIEQFINMLKMDSPIGKKMDFLIQEMNRETNTIGSKANSLAITNIVVEIKNEIENMREQVQNIE